MIGPLDWSAVVLSVLTGALGGAAFFAGLALGIRIAVRTGRPLATLAVSAGFRIAALLAAVWWIAGHGVAALAGFALAFLAVRIALVRAARAPVEASAR